jgi:hypothetical protein
VAINHTLEQVGENPYHGYQRARLLKQLLSKPCLRICGLCPDQHSYPQNLPRVNLDSEAADMWELRQLANNAEYGIFAIEDVPGAHSVFHDSRQRLVV